MTDEKQLQDDLSYVRAAVARAEAPGGPAPIYFLWAAIVLPGFALIDHVPQHAGLYWMIAGPLGGVLSSLLGWRAARARGQSSPGEGRRQWAHWMAMMSAIFLLVPLQITRQVAPSLMPRLVLLLVAFSYFTAGAYLDRRLRWVGLALAGCYLVTILQPTLPHLWTITAAAISASLVVCGLLAATEGRRSEGEPAS